MIMSTTSFAEAPSYGADSSKTQSLMARAFAWVVSQRRISRTAATLSSLSDATLKDIGIERADIERVARHGRSATGSRA
jgi:uncharacterized protein YjiS (DUF1127 family)